MTLAEAISSAAFIANLLIVLLVAARQLGRYLRHRMVGRESPSLLLRDLIFFWAVAILLIGSTIAGALGVELNLELWWVLVRTVLGTGALLVWLIYEWYWIGRDDEGDA